MLVYHIAPQRFRDAISDCGIRSDMPRRYVNDPNAGNEPGIYVWLSKACAQCYAMTEGAGSEPYDVWIINTSMPVRPITQHAGAGRIETDSVAATRLDWTLPDDAHWDIEYAVLDEQAHAELCALPEEFRRGVVCP